MSMSVTPAVGTALQSAAAASTMALACALVTEAIQRPLIDVVVQLAVGPVKGLADNSRIEVADPGHVLGPTRQRRGRHEERGKKPSSRAAAEGVGYGHGWRSRVKVRVALGSP